MPTAEQLKALIRSHFEGDGQRFGTTTPQSIAMAWAGTYFRRLP